MPQIVCIFDILRNEADVFQRKDYDNNLEKIGTIEAIKAGTSLVDIAQTYSATKIHVYGPEDYLSPIINDMAVLNFKRNNNIEIEVN